jgi:hypothetical protein
MADKQAVTELLNHAGVAYDTADIDFLRDMFADEGALFHLTVAGGDLIEFSGKEAIGGLFANGLEGQQDQRRHVITNLYFKNETDHSITGVSYMTLVVIADGVLSVVSSGVYTDDCVRQDGVWKIQKRSLQMDLPY